MTRRRRWLWTTGALAAVVLILVATIRIDDIHADGKPIWRWAWRPKIEERSMRVVVERWDEFGNPVVAKTYSTPSEDAERRRKEQDAKRKIESAVDDFHNARGGMAPVHVTQSVRDCPEYRGVGRAGLFAGFNWSSDWKARPPKVVWRQPIGGGWSSFIVVGDFAFTHEQRGMDEAVVCYEWKIGRQRWIHRYYCRFNEHWTGDGPRATPTFADGCIFALGGNGRLLKLDARNGIVFWQREILDDSAADNALFGMVGSPLVVDGKVIVCPGQPKRSVIAIDQQTGKPVWSSGDAQAAYSSPMIADLAGRKQVLNFNGEGLYSHDLATGTELWNVPWITNPPEKNNVCQPIVLPAEFEPGKSLVFISSGYGVGSGLFEIQQTNGRFSAAERWQSKSLKSKFSCCVLRGDSIFGLDDGILTCINLRTGERRWKEGRYGHGQLVLVDSYLLVLSEKGELVLLKADPTKRVELGKIDVLPQHSWSHPTPFGNHILVRNHVEAALVEIPMNSK
jgi:outer membrane protein assembly factor BamB